MSGTHMKENPIFQKNQDLGIFKQILLVLMQRQIILPDRNENSPSFLDFT